MYKNIYDLVAKEEAIYKSTKVPIVENYEWGMFEHIQTTILYKNSQFKTGNSDDKPFKNITRPILNLHYRAEGFDVKDIVIYVNDKYKYFKSFLVRKFYEKWARLNKLNEFIDEFIESIIDFGGVLVKKYPNDPRPRVVQLSSLAFVDQTDMLSGTICEKHFFSPEQLREKKNQGWENIDEVIVLAQNVKKESLTRGEIKETQTPGKYIEVYEVHGVFPRAWLEGKDTELSADNEFEDVRQLHIITFYKDTQGNYKGITLFKGKEKKLPYKVFKRDPIHGRALGFGAAEELFEPQVWTNWSVITKKAMLEQASKVIYQTSDETFRNKNTITNLDNGEVLIHRPNEPVAQVNTVPANITLFDRFINEWGENAKQIGAANEAIMGETPPSGTPFKLQELITSEAHSLHEYRKGKFAEYMDEIHRDWIIKDLAKEIIKDQEFLADIDFEDMIAIADNLVMCEANKIIKEKILSGEIPDKEEIEAMKNSIRERFMKSNKKFIQIFKEEFKGVELDVHTNIAGKQKNLSSMVDKLVNVFRQIIATPNVLNDPRMAKLFNQIIEASGLSPIDFYYPMPQASQMEQMSQSPKQDISQNLALVGAGQ